MEGAVGPYNGRSVEEVFKDFKGSRYGMIKSLTTDVEELYQQCDLEKENLCLYGLPSETWEVNLPAEEVPPELPEAALGINFAMDAMQVKDWLYLVAIHSDAWLLVVAFYFGARFGFEKNDRRHLFNMINELPTILEVVTETTKKKTKEKSSVINHNGNKRKPNAKLCVSESQTKALVSRTGPQSQIIRRVMQLYVLMFWPLDACPRFPKTNQLNLSTSHFPTTCLIYI
jgi:hypothetical protein